MWSINHWGDSNLLSRNSITNSKPILWRLTGALATAKLGIVYKSIHLIEKAEGVLLITYFCEPFREECLPALKMFATLHVKTQ